MQKLKLFVCMVAFMCSLAYNPVKAQAPVQTIQELPPNAIVTYFSKEQGIDPKIALAVMMCESHGNQSEVGDNGHAIGIFQYWSDTWERHSKEYGETLDRDSYYDQAKLATFAIAHHMGNEWTTYRAIEKGGKYTFYSHIEKKTITIHCKA